MAKTMEEYMSKTRADYGSGVTRPKINDKDHFELKGQFLKELRDNTFSGSNHEDANEHIEKVLEIVDLFHIPNITQDQTMLRSFLMSLTGAASRWLRNKPSGSIKTWEDLKEVILFYNGLEVLTRQILDSKGAIPTKIVADAKVAIQEMAEYSQKWHNGKSKTRSTETSDGLAAIQAQLKNLGREIKKVNEKVYATQVGWQYRVAAPGFCQMNNANPSYQERRQSMEESLSKFMNESAKKHEENSNLIKEIRASTDAAIRNQGASMKTLEIQIGQMSKVLQERGLGSLPSSTETNPRDHVKSISTTVEADMTPIRHIGSSQYAVSAPQNIHNDSLPRKEKDPGSFTLPCYINNICFENALADLGASVSVMPLSTYLNLGLGELAHTKLTVELADRSVKHPKGIAENILVGIGDEKIIFKTVKPASSLIKRVYMLSLRERMELDLEARLMGETLILNRSLNPLYGDYIELNDLNVPLELRGDQVDDLMPTIEEGEVEDAKTRNDDKMVSRIFGYPNDYDEDEKTRIDYAYNLKFSCMIGFEFVHANFFPNLPINVMSKKFYNSIMKDKIKFRKRNELGNFVNVPVFIGNFYVVTDFIVVEDMDPYLDDGMGDIVVGEPFCKVSCVETRRFDGIITIRDEDNSVTY
ncbi:zf-CCHC domain-containing protein [Tanacetum coccineum]